MNTVNLPPASVLRPELRSRLERLERLERRERQSRYARWHIPAPVEREPEGWLLTYLDLITLLLVMLVVMLAFSQPKATLADATAVATVERPAAGPVSPGEDGSPRTESGTAGQTPATQVASLSSTSSDQVIAAPDVPSPATPDALHGHSAAAPVSETGPSPDESGMPGTPTLASAPPVPAAARDVMADDAGPALLSADQTLGSSEQPMHAADRPAPVDVALVGSIRSSQSLQNVPPFSFDPAGTSSTVSAATAGATPDAAATALPTDAGQDQAPSTPPASADPSGKESGRAATPLPSVEELGLNGLGDNIDVIVNEESVSFRINNEILFTSGQADLMPSGLEVLTRLAEVLARNDYQIAVEGHTDPVPIQNDRFPSNWELSTGRATSVLRHLQSQGIPATRLRATGYADTRPIAPNDSQAGRAFNRRVELIMEMPRGARNTPQSSSSASTVAPLSLSGSASTGPIVRLR